MSLAGLWPTKTGGRGRLKREDGDEAEKDMDGLEERWEKIRSEVAGACRRAGRSPEDVTIVAVSKTVPIERIREAHRLGIRDFGESRLQEAEPKIAALPDDIVWHFVGRLQSNKAKRAASLVRVIHTVESERQVAEMEKAGREVQALIEVNVAREPQKAGVFPDDLDSMVQCLSSCLHVRYRGLMTIGPVVPDPELSRETFAKLAELGRLHGAEWLSMGMSADFSVAVQEGATHVRVGTALFGGRD